MRVSGTLKLIKIYIILTLVALSSFSSASDQSTILDAIKQIKNGNGVNSGLVEYLEDMNTLNAGYGFCMAGGRSESDCDDALGGTNTGYGLCMAGGRSESDCDDAL